MSPTVTLSATTHTSSDSSVASGVAAGDVQGKPNSRRRITRRMSTASPQTMSLKICSSLPRSLEPLDLISTSPTQTLASLRFLVLSYLADLERCLAEVESPTFDSWTSHEPLAEDGKEWARVALEMLEGIRSDVCSHLPEFHFADLSSMEAFVKSHLPDMPEVPNLTEMRSHWPDMPHIPDMAEMRSHLPDMPSMPDMDDVLSEMRFKLDDVRSRFHELDFHKPFGFIPTLSDQLQNLHSHLSSVELTAGMPFPNALLADLLESLLSSNIVTDLLQATPEVIEEGEDILERAAHEVSNAIKRSLDGMRLITYSDLPHPWRNNPFVVSGYRFIPVENWPRLVMSLFEFHNETLNIHTHLVPCILWAINLIPLYNTEPIVADTPEFLFMTFALLCLLLSSIWHTMSGCAHHGSMEFCARVDYVGIGWLISASVGTVVHYGLGCHPSVSKAFLGLCLASGLAGNIFPFMQWFNMVEYRMYRIAFFLSLAFCALGPMTAMSILHSPKEMHEFVSPVFPSLISYLIGLTFYALHFPERCLPENIQRKLDMIGGGSHAIWHCFIVLAVSQHKAAIAAMRPGMQCTL